MPGRFAWVVTAVAAVVVVARLVLLSRHRWDSGPRKDKDEVSGWGTAGDED